MHTISRLGATLVETMMVVVIVGLLAVIALPRAGVAADHYAAHTAADELANAIESARELAVTQRLFVAVHLDTAGSVEVRTGTRVYLMRPLRADFGVKLTATRDTLAYDPRGLGHGAANLTAIVRRGAAAETVVVSRLGRVRH